MLHFLQCKRNGSYRRQLQKATLPKALVYGAGSAGLQLMSAMDNNHEISVVGFLDDDHRLHGHLLNCQPIFSLNDLPSLIQSKGVTHVLLAIPSASRRWRNEILESMGKHHIVVCTLSSLTDLAEGRVTISDLCELDIDDLLGRESIEPNLILLAKNITDRVVLVTGAGGSIGSELCRQIVKLQPIKLILVEINEYALYTIHTELENINKLLDSNEKILIVPLLTTVQDRKRMSDIMETWQPDTVYHAAAYKHVPLVEYNLIAGVENNVFGTLNTAQIAINKGVSSFILVSTDKAVRPTSVMGASKRLSEICLQALFDFYSKKSKTKLSMVRFGNVMDSSGSVIPRFRKQISDGGPITITHPDISRYFMTIPEAAQLVIQAGAMAKGGEVFVLDMGEPVKIIDLAQRMIELSGLSIQNDNNLEGDIEITITGLRPGEKLYEELLIGENPQPTKHPKIQKANDQFIHWNKLENQLNCLKNLLSQNNVEEIIKLLQILVKDYNPNNEIVDWSYNEQKHNLINSNKS